MGVQRQKDLNKSLSLVETASLVPVLKLPSTYQYTVTSKSRQASNKDIGGQKRVTAEQHRLYIRLYNQNSENKNMALKKLMRG